MEKAKKIIGLIFGLTPFLLASMLKLDMMDSPEKFVLIHPVQNWPSRTWDAVKWMELTKKLNERNISVVSIGKESSEVGFFNVKKPIFNFEIRDGINLMNKTTLSQSWHLINKSMCF